MFPALLTGAALVGLLDLLLCWSGPDLREAGIVVLSGDLLVAALLGLSLRIAGRFLRWAALRPGQGLLVGGALSLGPLIGHVAESGHVGMVAALLGAPLAFLVGRRLSGEHRWCRVAIVPLLALPVVLSFRATSFEPPLPPRSGGSEAARGPDVVLVSIDTLRADRVDARRMPTLTGLGARGIRADYALAPADLTLPGHVSMLSGLSPLSHGVHSNHERMDSAIVLLQERFRAAGWRTAAVVSNWVIRGDAGFARGFEVFDESAIVRDGPIEAFCRRVGRHSWLGWTHLVLHLPTSVEESLYGQRLGAVGGNLGNARHTTDRSLALLDQLQAEPDPYLLFVHYMDPHTPYCPPPEFVGSAPCWSKAPERYRTGEPNVASWNLVHRIEEELGREVDGAEAGVALAAELYDGEASFVDRMLAELVARIESGGRPTWILVTGDHGEHLGEQGLMMHSNSLYEPNLRVPLVLTGPDVIARRLGSPPFLEDVAATLLACAGIPVEGLDGVDLRRPLPERRHVAIRGSLLALRDGPWKLLARLDAPHGEDLKPMHLYHIGDDPEELDDLLRSEPEVVARLQSEARSALASPARYESSNSPSEQERAALRALGYTLEKN